MKHFILIFAGLILINCSDSQNSKNELVNSENDISRSNSKLTMQSKTIAFQRDKYIYTFATSTQKEKKITKGFDPYISPNGEKLAYTKNSNGIREIYILDLKTSIEQKLKINDKNFYGPVWSPDSKYIAFKIMDNSRWQIGLIESNSADYSLIKYQSKIGIHSPTWTNDSKFILCHKLDTLYKFDLNGELTELWDLRQLLTEKYFFSSSSRFLITPDNKFLIFDSGVEEYMEGLHEPMSAIFAYNFKTKKINRLSRKGISSYEPFLDGKNEIYFSGFKKAGESRKIFNINISDTTLNLLVNNGFRPSISK